MGAVEVYLRLKTAEKRKDPSLSLPKTLAAGTGIGAIAGGGAGLMENFNNLMSINQLKGRLPELEKERAALKALGLNDRKLLKKKLVEESLFMPHDTYYNLRKGYERGLVERSRVSKTLRALKNMTRKSMLRHGLLGAGAGLGAGLLGATAMGHFDKEAFSLNDARKAGKAIAKHRVRAAPYKDDVLGILPNIFRKSRGPQQGKWIPSTSPAITTPTALFRPGKTTASNAKDIKFFSTGDVGRPLTKVVPSTKGVLNQMSPNEREMVNRITLLHENAERKGIRKVFGQAGTKIDDGYVDVLREGTPLHKLQGISGGHVSPDILAQESNMIATLPKEMTGVRDFFTKLRQNPDDTGVLKAIQKHSPGFEYGKQRINRHERKKLLNKFLTEV